MCGGPGLYETGTRPNLPPPYLKELLIDLSRLRRSLGFVTLTRAGLMTRNPLLWELVVVGNPPVGRMNARMTGVLILHVLTERTPDVLKRPKKLISRLNTTLPNFV
jgi:hypothetical protein